MVPDKTSMVEPKFLVLHFVNVFGSIGGDLHAFDVLTNRFASEIY
jgi:hypothetical protein